MAFAALAADGSINAWGGGNWGYGSGEEAVEDAPTDSGYIDIVANYRNFAALKSDGSVVVWGQHPHSVPGTGFTHVVATEGNAIVGESGFAALNTDGSIYSWGADGVLASPAGHNFTQIITSVAAFTAIRTDGTAVSWGNAGCGGDSSAIETELTNVIKIISNDKAFTALRSDHSYVSWGAAAWGGGNSGTGVTEITAISNAFCALKPDGSIDSWGGDITSSPGGTGFVGLLNSRTIDPLTFDTFLTVSPTQISEAAGVGAATGTVTRTGDLTGDLVVTLESSDTSEVAVPVSVTILDGQASATFPITAVDDNTADLIQPTSVTASVAGQYYGRVLLYVVDDGDGALFIDDGDAGYSTNVSPITVTDQGYQNDYQWILGTTPDSPYYIEYEVADIAPGDYEIATTWQTESELGAFPRHTAVKCEIYDGEALVDTVTVNQQQAPAADYTAGGENFEIIAPDVSITSDTLTSADPHSISGHRCEQLSHAQRRCCADRPCPRGTEHRTGVYRSDT